MPKVSQDALNQVKNALEQYEREVNGTPMANNTKNTYLLHSRNFVRWLNDDFQPGVNVSSRQR